MVKYWMERTKLKRNTERKEVFPKPNFGQEEKGGKKRKKIARPQNIRKGKERKTGQWGSYQKNGKKGEEKKTTK